MNKPNTLAESIQEKKKMIEPLVNNIVSGSNTREDDLRQNLHFEQTPLGVIEWDTNFKVIKWNPAAEKIFGYSKEEAFGKSANDLIESDSAKSIVNKIWEELINSKGGTRSTNQNIRKDGKIILCDWYNTPLVNSNGNVIGVASLVDDITEREKSQKVQNALYKISEAVHSFVDIQELYKEIHRIVQGLMKADNFYISLYNESTNLISFPYFVDEFDSQPEPESLGRGLTDYVLRTGNNMLIDAEEDLMLRKKGITDLVGPPSEIWLGVALIVDNKPIGVIVVQDYKDETTLNRLLLQ
jgi:PAS domain S-box-containing protein